MHAITIGIIAVLTALIIYLVFWPTKSNSYNPSVSYHLGDSSQYWLFNWNDAGDTNNTYTFNWTLVDKSTATSIASGSTATMQVQLSPIATTGGPLLEPDTTYTFTVTAEDNNQSSPSASVDFTTPPLMSGTLSGSQVNKDGSIGITITYVGAVQSQAPFIDYSNSGATAIVLEGEATSPGQGDVTFPLIMTNSGQNIIASGTVPAYKRNPGDEIVITVTAKTPVCILACDKIQTAVYVPSAPPQAPTNVGWSYQFTS